MGSWPTRGGSVLAGIAETTLANAARAAWTAGVTTVDNRIEVESHVFA